MTPKKRFLAGLLRSRSMDKVAVGCVNPTATKEQMDKLGVHFPSAHTNPEEMVRLALGAKDILGFDNVRVPFCQTVEAEALGCEVRMGSDNEPPAVLSHPYRLGNVPLIPEDFLSRGRIPVVIEATRKLREEVGDEVAIVAGIVGPFSLAGYLIGLNEILIATISDPEAILPFLELGVEIGKLYGKALLKAGADVICVEDMSASTQMISPQTYKDLVLPYHQRLFQELRGGISVLHICGDVTPILGFMAESGADALSIDHKVDLAKASQIRGRVALVGNLDPVGVLAQGNPEKVREAAEKAVNEGIDVLAPGCSIPLGTPTQNILAMHIQKPPAFQMLPKPSLPIEVFRRYDLLQKEEEGEERKVVNPLDEVREAVVAGDKGRVEKAVERALEAHDPLEVINKGLVEGMNIVGELWNKGEYFLPQVILSADALLYGMKICEERMGRPMEKKGRVVMHVAEGDIHSIGKDIVKAILLANGYEVIDLGVDVPVEEVVEAVKKYKPCLLTGTALMTTTMSAFPRIAKRLEEEGIEIPFACGGGAVNQEFCENFKFGIYGGKAINAPLIAELASQGKSWQDIRRLLHK